MGIEDVFGAKKHMFQELFEKLLDGLDEEEMYRRVGVNPNDPDYDEASLDDIKAVAVTLEMIIEKFRKWLPVFYSAAPLVDLCVDALSAVGATDGGKRLQKMVIDVTGGLVRGYEDDGWTRDEAMRLAEMTVGALHK